MVIRRTLRLSWYLAALVIVLAALGMVAGRILFPLLAAYPASVERMIQERTGHRLGIGRMNFAWSAHGPEMRFHDVRLWVPGRSTPLVRVEELALGVDLFATLRQRQVVTSRIRLEGTALSLVRTADGHLELEGMPGTRSDFLALLLAQPRIQARRVRVRFRDERALPAGLGFEILRLDLRHAGDRRQLWFEARPEGGLGRRVKGGFDLTGWSRGPGGLEGVWYLAGESLALEALERRIDPAAPWILAGMGDLALWGRLAQGRSRQVLGRIAVHLPSVQPRGDPLPVFVAGAVETRFRWRRDGQGMQLDLAPLRIQQASQPPWETSVAVRLVPQAGGWRLRLALERFDTRLLAGLTRLVAGRLPVSLRPLAAARGRVEGLQAAFRVDADHRLQDVRLETGFRIARLPAAEWLPGIERLAGRLRYGAGRGEVVLDGTQVVVEMPRLLPARLSFERLAGRLRWQRSERGGWEARLEDLVLENRDLGVTGTCRLRSRPGHRLPWANIDLRIHHARVAAVPAYLPARVMPPRAVDWLKRALVGGHVTSGYARIQGPLDALPFDRGGGRLDILARVEGGILDYHPRWQRIEDIRADVRFLDQGMQIRSSRARIHDVRLSDVEVEIRDLRRTPLTARGQARGPFETLLRYVRESPLAHRGYPIARLHGGGSATLDLALTVPLRPQHGDRVRVRGTLQLSHDRLDVAGTPVRLEGLSGRLAFTDAGVSARDLQAHLWQAPVRLAIATRLDGAQTRVEADGPIPVLAHLPDPGGFLGSRLHGVAPWHVQLDIARGGGDLALALASNLEGIGVDLPPPLGKPAAARRPFRLNTRLDAAGRMGPVYLVYGTHSAALEFDTAHPPALRRAALLFGGPAARLPDRPGLTLGGRLERLSLDAWLRLWHEAGGGARLSVPVYLDLSIGRLQFLHLPWNQVHLRLDPPAPQWRLAVACDRLDGEARFDWPPTQGLRITLTRFDLPSLAGPARPSRRLDPQVLPPLSVHVKRLSYAGIPWGRLDLVTRPLPGQGLRVDTAVLENDWLHARGTGSWTREQGREYSRFRIQVHDTDLGHLLERAGYGQPLDGGRTHAELTANWEGPPWAFDLAQIEGTLSVNILDGRLLRFRPGAGRLLGLLNLQAIPRRLALDFSDLFKKGFVFDRLQGRFTFVGGDAYTTDLTIEAPAARIEIAGRTGLAARDYDEVVTVTPHLRGSLPIAGALAGGPAVGAALLLADRLLGERLDRIGRVQYTVTGPWDAPKFRRLAPRKP